MLAGELGLDPTFGDYAELQRTVKDPRTLWQVQRGAESPVHAACGFLLWTTIATLRHTAERVPAATDTQ